MAQTATLRLEHSFVDQLAELTAPWSPASFPSPRLLLLNEQLADELGLDATTLRSDAGVAVLVGNAAPEGSRPVAQAYSGHQFGGFSPRLGDGRAALLGEVVDEHGVRRDLHLKGSGRTAFARGGDGKAAVGPMLREYVVSEAMHAMGIPTTRALAVVSTGEHIAREELLPGAVLGRVAASHLRVGTFQYAATTGDLDLIRRLAAYAIARHYPAALDSDDPVMTFYRSVVDAQASLIARWMLVGFVHGVMNTDNMTISGETIDYGPCAFVDAHDPTAVFSSIDHGGRYAFGNQPMIAQWNLARLAETLLSFMGDDEHTAVTRATEALHSFDQRYAHHRAAGLRLKLGLSDAVDDDAVLELGASFEALLHEHGVDHTNGWRALSEDVRGQQATLEHVVGAAPLARAALATWRSRWQLALGAQQTDRDALARSMDRSNPRFIPRNHIIEAALSAATDGDLGPVEELIGVISDPFSDRPGLERYAEPAPPEFGRYRTFCGT